MLRYVVVDELQEEEEDGGLGRFFFALKQVDKFIRRWNPSEGK